MPKALSAAWMVARMVPSIASVGISGPPCTACRNAAAWARWPLSCRPFQSVRPLTRTDRKSSMITWCDPASTSIRSLPATGGALP